MPDHPLLAGVDLRSSDIVLALPAPDGTVALRQLPAAAAAGEDGIVYGDDAVQLLALDPGCGWAGLLDRVGDPEPCRLGEVEATAADLVARCLASALPQAPTHLRILAPDDWSDTRHAALSSALVAAGLSAPDWVDELSAVAPPVTDGTVLLLTTGASSTAARVLEGTSDGWRVAAATAVPFGAHTIADVTFERAAAALEDAAGRGLTGEENRLLAAVCSPAVHRLPTANQVTLTLRDLPPTPLTRATIERALHPMIQAAFDGLPGSLAALGVQELPARVLLEGPGTRIPNIALAISTSLNREVTVAPTDAAAVLTTGGTGGEGSPANESTPDDSERAPEAVASVGVAADADVAVLPLAVSPPEPEPTRSALVGVDEAPVRDRRSIKVVAAALGLVLALAGLGAVAGGALLDAVGAALRPAALPTIPGGTLAPSAGVMTPTLERPSSSTVGGPATTSATAKPTSRGATAGASTVPALVPGTTRATSAPVLTRPAATSTSGPATAAPDTPTTTPSTTPDPTASTPIDTPTSRKPAKPTHTPGKPTATKTP